MDDELPGKGMTALITGGSSGIGLELAKLFAHDGYSLVLVARDKERLSEAKKTLKELYPFDIQTISADLSRIESCQEIYDALEAKSIKVDVLVNNAGFAAYGQFKETDLNKEISMIDTNVVALTVLTKLYLRDMVARKSGRILNVASTAAFMSGPMMAVYYATKAYVLSFSEAIANELEGSGVTVTVLCPGPTSTGFEAVAGMKFSKQLQSSIMKPQRVAKEGYSALMSGKAVAIPGIRNNAMVAVATCFPRGLVTKAVRKIQDSKTGN